MKEGLAVVQSVQLGAAPCMRTCIFRPFCGVFLRNNARSFISLLPLNPVCEGEPQKAAVPLQCTGLEEGHVQRCPCQATQKPNNSFNLSAEEAFVCAGNPSVLC